MESVLLGSLIQARCNNSDGCDRCANHASNQLRSSEKNIIEAGNKASSRKSVINSYNDTIDGRHDLLLASADDSASSKWIMHRFGLDSAPPEQHKLYILIMMQIDFYQNIHYRYTTQGLFPEDLWSQWRNSMQGSFATDEFRTVWNSGIDKLMPDEFRKYVESDFDDRYCKKRSLAESSN